MDMAFHSSFGANLELPDGSGFDESVPRLAPELAPELAAELANELAGETETALRPLGWAELCARLVASQDFRAAQGSVPARNASFHGSAAQWLTMLHASASDRPAPTVDRDFADSENEPVINPTPSVAGKAMSGIALLQAGGAIRTASAHRTESEMSA